ncbi:glutaminyl-peptide cyclotransferase [Streptomyces sp. ventii]|uniref:Glutaminyl-peptide cyclotransferase n=1 Tax=Streptomyces spiramenti TaxID=2720606 RepID=A0ABX1AM44_9ACTN|nr:glutaminyl-peptide cyclotransferase [Streptomyces spiramenti]NJP66904.1 glutaminyl-peptide cyclotransferase [Streptomyces spiramenti]
MAVGAGAVAAATAVALLAVGARSAGDAEEPEPRAAPEQLRVRVLETLPHDTGAFTQGLEVADGVLYEGTGRAGRSWVSATNLADGAELARADLADPLFGEGLTLTGDALWQLTWRDGVAFERDPETLDERRTVRYEGEGWGLCHQRDADRLVMSDGSDTLRFRDPVTFEPTGEVRVTSESGAVDDLNELECVGGEVYANVWHSDTILRIDPDAGRVTAEIDASGLLTSDERRAADVLNGIAFSPDHDAFLVTGKLWPHLFVVEFVPA